MNFDHKARNGDAEAALHGATIPLDTPGTRRTRRGRGSLISRAFTGLLTAITAVVLFQYTLHSLRWQRPETVQIPFNAATILDTCRALDLKPGPPADFKDRTVSDRFVPGTKSVLIKKATLWTGRLDGLEQYTGDLLLESGIIKAVGVIDESLLSSFDDLVTIDAHGAWVTPGIVDLHSHIGVMTSPSFSGANDGNSRKGPILPWLRALDALNTHNDAYKLSVAGGVTTALVLPGSANAIGGQGIVIKYRPSTSRAPTGLLLENPYSTNTSEYEPSKGFRWRQMKHACGENPDRVYSGTRMDTTWAFRQAYDKARQIKNEQDAYCAKAFAGRWNGLGEFPQDYQWEALVDVLRGRVKVHTHCYETVDLDDLVRITNEFEFSIAAFHHAHETYLVPDTLKSAYGGPPAAALFATNARYKRESYRGSEFAPKILADNGIPVVLKSDHPVLDSRYLLHEAQQAHYFGLPAHLALASVTTTPASAIGQEHRIGYLKAGYDADIVLWDSHPLALGATPQQVWIDGIPQISESHAPLKPGIFQGAPDTPDFDEEAKLTLEHDGLPPLQPKFTKKGVVVFTNFTSVFVREAGRIQEVATLGPDEVFVVKDGKPVCRSSRGGCASFTEDLQVERLVYDLRGGSIAPGLVSFGSPLGLQEIQAEGSTVDGVVYDPIFGDIPTIIGDEPIIRAADGLQYSTRHALLAFRSGVTTAVTAPQSAGFLAGLSAVFSTGAEHKLKEGALLQDIAAVHVSIRHSRGVSVSTQIAALRNLLTVGNDASVWIEKVIEGHIPLVVDVHSADAITSVISLKKEVEEQTGRTLRITLAGATEAHIVAQEIAEAGIGVIVYPSRPFPYAWEDRRIVPGPPLTEHNIVSALLSHNITVGVGIREAWQARNTRFDVAWVAFDARCKISREEAIALATVNLEELLGVHTEDGSEGDLVATRGGDLLGFEGKVAAVISPARGVVDLLD